MLKNITGTPGADLVLKDVFKDAFLIGAAVNPAITSGADKASQDILLRHFNSITVENVMKAALINPEPGVYNSYAVEQQPEFPDGLDAMYDFLRKNIGYPQLAKEIGLSGIVYVQFVVSKEGKIEHAKIVRGVGGGLDQEALRVVNLMPAWKPGKHNGKPVAVNFTLLIKFQLLK